jgi:hydroxymethylpyrimidine/phosphomethylpyrimidine kinase
LLLPRVTVLTPNLPEARVLAGASAGAGPGRGPCGAAEDAAGLARAIHALGPRIVVVTGGHRAQAIDVFYDGSEIVEIAGERFLSGAAHGSGCTHSSVLAARLACGDTPLQAARVARRRAGEAVRDGLGSIGAGAGPVDILGIGRSAPRPVRGQPTPFDSRGEA